MKTCSPCASLATRSFSLSEHSPNRKEDLNGSGRCPVGALAVRTNFARRYLVGAAGRCFYRSLRLHCLLHLGGSAGPALQVRSVPFAILLAGIDRRSLVRLVRGKAGLDARVGHGGGAHPLGTWRIPCDVLLLPRSVLQGFLGGPSLLHGGRAPQEVSR